MLGFCRHNEVLRIKPHNNIREMMAKALSRKGCEVQEEVHPLLVNGGSRPIDIIATNRKEKGAFIR